MTTKEYKKMCRIKATLIAKTVSCILVLIVYTLTYLNIIFPAYLGEILGILIWFYVPDLVVFILSKKYKISFDALSYW